MDPQAEGLEFLDWASLDAPDRCRLHAILYGAPLHPEDDRGEEEEEQMQPEDEVAEEWPAEEQEDMPPVDPTTQQPTWEQQEYGEMPPGAVMPQTMPPRGPPVALYQPMVPPPVLPAPGGPPPPQPGQSNVNAIYPLIMQGQNGMILGNVNLSVNANVQSYVTPMSGYHQQQGGGYEVYEKDKRGRTGKPSKNKRDYKQEEQVTQYQPQFMYHQQPTYTGYMPHHPTAQQVSGPPLFIGAVYNNAPQHHPQQHHHHPQLFYPPQMYIPMHPMQSMPMQQEVPPQAEPVVPQPVVVDNYPVPEEPVEEPQVVVEPSPVVVEQQQVQQQPQLVVEDGIQEAPQTPSPQPQPVPVVPVQVQQEVAVPMEPVTMTATVSAPCTNTFDLETIKAELPEPETILPPPQVEEPQPVPEKPMVSPAPIKSWASIVQASPQPAGGDTFVPKPLARVNPFTSGPQQGGTVNSSSKSPPPQQHKQQSDVSHMSVNPLAKTRNQLTEQDMLLDDPMLYRLGEYLCKYTLDHRSSALQPRGLTNRSNWCYVNATLQALLACPPFYNLMRELPVRPQNRLRPSQSKSATPIIDAVVEFMNQFSTLPHGSRPARREKNAARRAAPGEEGSTVEVPQGTPFEPSCVYAMLGSIRSAAFSAVEGRQEDAEEFLSCLLNALNDEMLELMKLVDAPVEPVMNGQEQPVTNGEHHSEEEEGTEEEWTVMRGKNRACLTRRSDFGRTPVSDIFRGQLCSHVQRKGDQQSETVQPFYTLQLDIEKARSVKEALEQMVDRDWLEGVTCSRTQQQVEAWQQVTLEELPPVLLLHLKWFDYKQDGCSKIMKNMEYSVDLKIENKLLSNSKAKYSPKQRVYKLFAVVYHDGKEASKGHYITDAYHSAMGVWVRYDDSQVRVVTEYTVTHPRSPAVPYILYYRRSDTMGQPSLNH